MSAIQSAGQRGPATKFLQFRLRTLVLLTALASVILGFAVYYRWHPAKVNYRFARVDGAAVASILSGREATPVEGSPYAWVMLDENELDDLLQLNGQPAPILHQKSRVISGWPMVAETCSYTQTRELPLNQNTDQTMVTWESGTAGGFLGSRRAGVQPQFRVDMKVTYNWPAGPTLDDQDEQIKGKLFYEGKAPQRPLVFFAPLEKDNYHVIVFDVEQ